MSIKAMTWAFGLPLEPRAKIALLAIADNARDDGIAWPSRDLIAEKSSQSRATVNRRLKSLAELGVLGLFERYREDGSQTTDEIRLNLTVTPEDVEQRMTAARPHSDHETDEDSADEPGDETGPEDEGRGYQAEAPPMHSGHPGVSQLTPPGHHCGNPLDEPSLEPDSPPSPPPGGLGPMPKIDKDAVRKRETLWQRFLGSYPGIAAMDQAEAKDEFGKLSIDDADWAISASPMYAAECGKLKKPPKNAHLWLRKRMFANFTNSVIVTATSFPRDSVEGKALIKFHDAVGCGEGFRKIYVRDVVTYRKGITAQMLAFAAMPPREEWVKLDHKQAGAWSGIGRDLSAIPRSKAFAAGDFAPWPWPPSAEGKIYSATTDPPDS